MFQRSLRFSRNQLQDGDVDGTRFSRLFGSPPSVPCHMFLLQHTRTRKRTDSRSLDYTISSTTNASLTHQPPAVELN